MRRAYLIVGLVLTACPAVWSAAELADAVRSSGRRETPAVVERTADALVRARTVSDEAPAPGRIGRVPETNASAGSPAGAMVSIDAFRRVSGSVTQLSGTGVVASRLGHIYAPYFVVRKADALIVTFHGGQRAPARLLGGDQQSQLAVLKVSFVPEGIAAPDLVEKQDEQAGRPVALFLPDGSRTRELAGSIVGEKPQVGPLRNVLEVTVPDGVEISGGITTNERGALVGLALATTQSDQPGKQSVLILPASRMQVAVGRMVRGEPGTEAPEQANLTVI